MTALTLLAKTIADSYTANGKELVVDTDSPLRTIVSAIVMNNTKDLLVDHTSSIVELADEPTSETMESTDGLITEVSSKLINIIKLRRSILVNTIIPETKSFTKDVIDEYDKYVSDRNKNMTNVKIVRMSIPQTLLTIDMMGQLPTNITTVPSFSINYRVTFGTMDYGVVRNKLLGNPLFGIDKATWSDYVNSIPKDMLEEVLSTYFSTISSGAYPWVSLKKSSVVDIDKVLLIYVLASLFIIDIPDTATASSGTYKPAMNKALSYTSMLLAYLVGVYNNAVNAGTVVLRYDWDNNTIVVYDNSFQSYLDNDGSVEVLYGALISKRMVYNTSGINNNKDQLTSIWNKYVALRSMQVKNHNLVEIGAIVLRVFNKHMDEITEAEQELISSLGLTIDGIKHEAKQFLSKPSIKPEEFEEFCMDLLCKTRWRGGEFDKTLERFNELVEDNKNLTSDEAIGIAIFGDVINYLIPRHVSLQ